MRKTLLIVMLVLGTVTPGTAQMAVIDSANLAEQIRAVGQLIAQLGILREQLADMRIQAAGDMAVVNLDTNLLLQEQADVGDADEILYGKDGSSVWNETFAFDHVWEDGTWQEAALERDRAAWKTHRSLLRQLEMRQAAFAADQERIDRLQNVVEASGGRNAILIHLGDLNAEMLQQQRMTQQLLMSLTNAVTVQSGYEINKDVAERAQERAFLLNYHKRPQLYPWTDEGLR